MLRYALPVLVAGAAFLFVPSSQAEPVTAPAALSGQQILMEPVVVFNVTGGTLTGTVHRQLAVYNNGFATIALSDSTVFPTPGQTIDVKTANIGQDAAFGLLFSLLRAGAGELPDQQVFVSDVPLNTLTVLRGREVAASRTFSYWIGFGKYAAVSQTINNFISTTFPNLGTQNQ